MTELIIIGGGLAGCEAAYQAAKRGIQVILYEMRPFVSTGAHKTARLAELVCSNSLGTQMIERPGGVLLHELRSMGSMLLECAEKSAVPGGSALAVDRELFADLVEKIITSHTNITLIREEVVDIPPAPVIIASGPLTSSRLSESIKNLTGQQHLFFYDAIAPIISAESIDFSVAFRASRWEKSDNPDGDYLNCPFSEEEYNQFIYELVHADRIPLREYEDSIHKGVKAGHGPYFEGCLPVEIIAERGKNSLAFGTMRPIGLRDPRTGRRPFAVVQLRQENLSASMFNLVGFQTNLLQGEQKRVFRMIPGLKNAEFLRYGQIHRNTFIASPFLLAPTLEFRNRPGLFFAGQIIGVEGYAGNIATGLLAGINAAKFIKRQPLIQLPDTTMLGALCKYISSADLSLFQPMKANFGILAPLESPPRGKMERARLYSQRMRMVLYEFLRDNPLQ